MDLAFYAHQIQLKIAFRVILYNKQGLSRKIECQAWNPLIISNCHNILASIMLVFALEVPDQSK